MKRVLFFAILFFPLLAFSQTRQDSVGVKTISSLTELTANIDTSYEVIFHDPSTGKISYRASVGEFLKTINALPSVIGTSQIINATIINEDISGSAAIALSKLQNLTANRLVGRDTTGTGIPESLTVGYGFQMGTDRIDIDTVSASGLVSKSRLTNALDDVSTTGGIFEQENTTTLASANTTNNYHEGNIGIGDFSGNSISAGLHLRGSTNASIRLSDDANTDSTTLAYIDFYRGVSTSQIGRFGFTNTGDADMYLRNVIASGGIVLQTNGLSKAKLFPTGQLQLLDYGSGTFSGTAAYNLQVDASGNIIETAAGGGGGYWTQTGSDIYYNTGNIAVGTTSPNNAEILAANTSAGSQVMSESTSGPAILTTNRTDGTWMSINSTSDGVGNSILLEDGSLFRIAHADAGDNADSKSFGTADASMSIDTDGHITAEKKLFVVDTFFADRVIQIAESGVSHPFTSQAADSVMGQFTPTGGNGGLNIKGYHGTGTPPAVKFIAHKEDNNTAYPAIEFSAYKSDGGTGRTALSGTEIIATFKAGATTTVDLLANGAIRMNSGPIWLSGSGTPEGSVTAPIGSFYSRTDGSTGTSFYVKESGTGNTGWVAK